MAAFQELLHEQLVVGTLKWLRGKFLHASSLRDWLGPVPKAF